ncbi:MAG: murein L,D-transpeptidase catalytic domain family protein [Bacteroidales bacterium]
MSNPAIRLLSILLIMFSLGNTSAEDAYDMKEIIEEINKDDRTDFYSWFYEGLKCDVEKPSPEALKRALTGFFNLKSNNSVKTNLLTIIDFSLSSNMERMWIVDMNNKQVIHSSLVAHGRNSGQEFAEKFSNISGSYQSSLGFYITDAVYQGKHGMSLRLDGAEPGINDNARQRAVVMHSADYVSNDFIRKNGRLGRSYGCPSIPLENHEEIITLLSGGSCLYIHFPCVNYEANSVLLQDDSALPGIQLFLSDPLLTFSFPN